MRRGPLTTSQGIILIDTLNNPREAETFIEGGLRQLGLDPTQIKYIVITHGHADHHGGAQYLADKFKAEMVMSEADWAFLEGPQAPQAQPDRGPIPKRGRAVKDGDRLTLGDTTIELYVTPPHTPGTLSLIFPLKDGAMSHVGGLWGGTGFDLRAQSRKLHDLCRLCRAVRRNRGGEGRGRGAVEPSDLRRRADQDGSAEIAQGTAAASVCDRTDDRGALS